MIDSTRAPIVALLASFNRKDMTLACLASLMPQLDPNRDRVRLIDAGSSDGTIDAVASQYPEVDVEIAPGLYWARSMEQLARSTPADLGSVLLFLNDDVVLEPDAVDRLVATLEAVEENCPRAMVVGSTVDPETGRIGYGGMRRSRWLGRLRLTESTDGLIVCDSANFNIVFMRVTTYWSIGGLSREFEHSKADWDFGFRLTRSGGVVVQAAGAYGACRVGGTRQTWLRPGLAWRERLGLMEHPKGAPFRESCRFALRHYGLVRGSISIAMNYVRLAGAHVGIRTVE